MFAAEHGMIVSIRTALVLAMLGVVLLSGAILGVMEITSIDRNVIREAQSRVDHDLGVARNYYQKRLEFLVDHLETEARSIQPTDTDVGRKLQELKRSLDFHILNLCDVDGRAIAGSYPDSSARVPVVGDGLLRRALEGEPVWGTVLLESDRLFLEGGPALQKAMIVRTGDNDGERQTTEALFWWSAVPLRDDNDRVVALLYGGRALNFNYALVDELRELVFGAETFHGKPVGTVTLFLKGVRVATNVLGPDRSRAVGTRVSSEVHREVLDAGHSWSDRAWVVDAWYLSGYEPLRDPEGDTVGMLYVGLLEAPYAEMRRALVLRFLLAAGLMCVVACGAALVLVRRITRPLGDLSRAAGRIALGYAGEPTSSSVGYSEIEDLSEAFIDMQKSIAERDSRLRRQNEILEETNEKLRTTNTNYMKMLGFITHELKSPMSTIQTMIDALVNNFSGELPGKANHALMRIKKNCEETQDMIGDYLDLSRSERGELVVNKLAVDFGEEVVRPCVAQYEQLFASRRMVLDVDCPRGVLVEVDSELVMMALGNFLSNAVKYGREGGRVRVRITMVNGCLEVSVWNEGVGFSESDDEKLFRKFSRVRDRTTRGTRGSGLGLYLTKEIVELHGGRVRAESEPGQWARFSFELPASSVHPHGQNV